MFLFTSASLILAIYLLKLFLDFYKTRRQLDQVFQVIKGWPIIGVADKFLNPENALHYGLEVMRMFGNVSFGGYLFMKPFLIVCDPPLAEVILSSNVLIDKGREYDFARNWFGEGLLTSTGQKWKNRRKILTPSFHYKILEDFVEVFDQKSKVLAKNLRKEAVSGEAFDTYKYVTLCTLDIICETAMGTSLNSQETPDLDFVESNKNMCRIMYLRALTPLRFDFIYKLSKWCRMEKESLRVLRNFSRTVIEKRRKVLEQKGGLMKTSDELDEFGVKTRNTFLDVLLKATIDGRPLTDEEIREEVDTFMFEGHDTTAIAISFSLYLLGQHQDVQQKVYEEIVEVLGPDREAPITYEKLQNLKYTEMFLKESLRLYPSVSLFSRTLCEDVPYENGVIPKGMDVLIIPFLMHRNEKVYPDPLKFDPERFSVENCTDRHAYAYLPFSAGPRNCIGQKFAMLELKSTVSKVLRFYEIVPVPNYKVKPHAKLTLQSSNGMRVKLKARN